MFFAFLSIFDGLPTFSQTAKHYQTSLEKLFYQTSCVLFVAKLRNILLDMQNFKHCLIVWMVPKSWAERSSQKVFTVLSVLKKRPGAIELPGTVVVSDSMRSELSAFHCDSSMS